MNPNAVTLADTTKAALERLGRALVLSGAGLKASFRIGNYPLGRGISVELLISATVDQAAIFNRKCKPWRMHYESPVRFDNGSLIPLYETPEDEIAARANVTARAKDG